MPRKVEENDVDIMYHVRIHEVDGVDDNSIADFMCGLDGPYVISKETEAKRVHYQGFVISRIKEGTIRARIKKAFPTAVGNKGYNLKEAEKPESLPRYICKGDSKDAPPTVVCKRGIMYTDDWVAEQHKLYWEHELAEARELKKAKQNVTEVIWEKVDQIEGEVTCQKVVSIIVDCYTAVGKAYDLWGVRRLRNVIMSKYCKKWKAHMKELANLDDVAIALSTGKYNGEHIVGEEGLDI